MPAADVTRRRWNRFLNRFLGHRCYLCRVRVFPRDLAGHFHNEHAGDR